MASIGPSCTFYNNPQLDDHFGIRLAIKRIAMLQQLIFQFIIVRDDATMYTNDIKLYCARIRTGTVAWNTRMYICLTRLTVGSPMDMTDITGSFQRLAAICFLNQIGQAPLCFHNLCQIFSVTDSQAGWIISSIFKFWQGPSSRIDAACRFPVKPTITHIDLSLPLFTSLVYYTFPLTKNDFGELPESSLTLSLISLFHRLHWPLRRHTSDKYHDPMLPP